jgi:hypothetical protein
MALLLEIVEFTAVVTHLVRAQIPAPQLVAKHPGAGRVEIGQADALDVIGERVAFADLIAVMTVEQRLGFCPDNQRITTPIRQEVGFQLAELVRAQGWNETAQLRRNNEVHQHTAFLRVKFLRE